MTNTPGHGDGGLGRIEETTESTYCPEKSLTTLKRIYTGGVEPSEKNPKNNKNSVIRDGEPHSETYCGIPIIKSNPKCINCCSEPKPRLVETSLASCGENNIEKTILPHKKSSSN